MMSCHQHGYPRPSLATPPYNPLLLADLQGYIPYQYRAAICRFELVIQPLFSEGDHRSTSLMSSSPTSPAVSRMSGLSNFDSFHDGWEVAVELLLCGVLPHISSEKVIKKFINHNYPSYFL